MKKKIEVVLLLTFILASIFTIKAAAFSTQRADFSIVYNNLKIPFQTFSIFVLPEEKINIQISDSAKDEVYSFENDAGQYLHQKDNAFNWQAPKETGNYSLTIKLRGSNLRSSKIKLNVFVLIPFEKKEGKYLEGFRIGNYPKVPTDKRKHYSKPEGFFKIDESNLNIKLTPHFKVKKFLTNQSQEFPQYIVIQESLLLKLEYFLEEINKAGIKADSFGIVSSYRSPYFNKKIGNNTGLSRHVFGDAADIYIDNSGNDWMDDLNGDGHSNINDANILYNLAVKFDQKDKFSQLKGGVCSYKGNGVRGPFIHIDTRGYHVSW
jgi:hypothetical protein